MQLVWDNCKAYNPEGPFYVLADKMERHFKKMIRNYLPNIQVTVPSTIIFIKNLSDLVDIIINSKDRLRLHLLKTLDMLRKHLRPYLIQCTHHPRNTLRSLLP